MLQKKTTTRWAVQTTLDNEPPLRPSSWGQGCLFLLNVHIAQIKQTTRQTVVLCFILTFVAARSTLLRYRGQQRTTLCGCTIEGQQNAATSLMGRKVQLQSTRYRVHHQCCTELGQQDGRLSLTLHGVTSRIQTHRHAVLLSQRS